METGPIAYRVNVPLNPEAVAAVLRRSGIRRPVDDVDRIRRMVEQANLIVTAWDGERLVGIARALTDFSYCCYLSDLAVDAAYQRQGIGQELVRRVREQIGEESMLLLLSALEAMDYYPKLGFEKVANAWIIHRQR
ncbi:MAG TPA: GNAT family N-acetyltransferase [Aggregatilineaceae bacterium]|nr:GNAT family N-acetyltransferase [Aggregatilineaceae bacterium]